MRKLDLVFLAGMLASIVAASGVTYLVHRAQVRRYSAVLLDRAQRAEELRDLPGAISWLRRYLALNRKDGKTWQWYARLRDQLEPEGPRRVDVFLLHEEALLYSPGDPKLLRRCVDLALEIGRPDRAQRHIGVLLEQASKRSEMGPEVAELKELSGRCNLQQSRFEKAAKDFDDAVAADPTRVTSYFERARLCRYHQLGDATDADDYIERMVKNNPNLGGAYLGRFLYNSEYHAPGDPKDLYQALELSPDDPEILITAASDAEQKSDVAAARAFLERGLRVDPGNAAAAAALASVHVREGAPDRAEVILRQAYQAKASVGLAFKLAETLILQDKIEGEDQASAYMGILRSRGLEDTYVPYLEARIEVQHRNWAAAVRKIQAAWSGLKAEPQIFAQLCLMLAECYGHLGLDEERLAALRQAIEGGIESARVALAQALTESGQPDQALSILFPLADRQPAVQLDIARLMIEMTLRQPANRRDWSAVEQRLLDASKAVPEQTEALTLLRADLLAARGQHAEARTLLVKAQTANSRGLRYRVALARLADVERKGNEAIEILDKAEGDLGPSLDIALARLAHWLERGGIEAKAAVARLAESWKQVPAAERPRLLDQLARAEIQLGEPARARDLWRELLALEAGNIRVLTGLFDLALQAKDKTDTRDLLNRIREIEGDSGATWRFLKATSLIGEARQGRINAQAEATTLAAEIAEQRQNWWGASLLNAQIAELRNQPEQALSGYREAVRLGNAEPVVIRRLLTLLSQRGRYDEIERLAQVLRDRRTAPQELAIVDAVRAMRSADFTQALALARQIAPENSSNFADHLALGFFYSKARQTLEAGKHFRRAVELAPAVPSTWVAYVQHLVQAKQADEAKAAVEAARKALPAGRSGLTLAECALVIGDTVQAETLLQSALNENPGDPLTLQTVAGFYVALGRIEEAGKTLDSLLSLEGNAAPDIRAWAIRTRASLLTRTRRRADCDQALHLVEENLAVKPDSVEDLRLKASILALRPRQRHEAIRILEPLSGANQLPPNEQFVLAQLYLDEGQGERYQGEMLRIIHSDAKNPQHLAHFVNYLIGGGQLDVAERWLADLKQIDPQGLATLELEARMLSVRKREPELLSLLQTRGRQAPDQVRLVADLLSRYGFDREAETAYRAFIAREPKQLERSLVLALFLAKQDRVVEALELLKTAWRSCRPDQVAAVALELYDAPSASEAQRRQVEAWAGEAVRMRPNAVVLASKLGAIWLRKGQFKDAEELFRRLLISAPDNADVLNNLAWLLALRDQNKIQEALALIERAIDAHGPTPPLVDTRAVVLIKAGQLERAVQDLVKVRSSNPTRPSYALHLAWAYRAKGQTDEARACLNEAEKLGLKSRALDPLELAVFLRLRHELFPG
jgi:tetratricopeptide (TPR) repeat protein